MAECPLTSGWRGFQRAAWTKRKHDRQAAIREAIVAQFRRPTGKLGKLAGFVMAHRASNRQRNHWAVELLRLQPGERVLELGCGPGLGVADALADGVDHVLALDHSIEMIRQAEARNRRAADAGAVSFRLGGLEMLKREDGPVDAAFMVNVVHFLPDRIMSFDLIRELLGEGGRLAVIYQPRLQQASDADIEWTATELCLEMEEAGFVDIEHRLLPLKPMPAIGVIGHVRAKTAVEKVERPMLKVVES